MTEQTNQEDRPGCFGKQEPGDCGCVWHNDCYEAWMTRQNVEGDKKLEKTQQELLEEWVSEEIDKLRNQHPRYAAMSTEGLRPLALRIIAVDRTQSLRKIVKEDLEHKRSTVGNLYGKTRDQILKEQEEK